MLQFVKSLSLTHRVVPMETAHLTHHAVHVAHGVVDTVLPDLMASLTHLVEPSLKCLMLPRVQQDLPVTLWRLTAPMAVALPELLDALRHTVLTAPMVLQAATFPTLPPDLLVTENSMAALHSG